MPRHGLSPASSHALSSRSHDAPNLRVRRGKRRSRTSTRLAIESLESRQLLSTYTIEDLGTLGGNGSLANAINAEGQVVGSAQLANGTSHAVLWNPGQAGKDLGTLGGSTSTALGINILGDIVGDADTTTALAQPFEFPSGGSMTDLTNAPPQNTLATLLTARGVSDTGVIVGQGLFNAIDLFFTAPYAFDPASGTIIALDITFDVIGEAVAVGGTRAVANLDDHSSIIASRRRGCQHAQLLGAPPRDHQPNAERRDRYLRAQRLGDAIRLGVRYRFFRRRARGAVDDPDGRPHGHRHRPGSCHWRQPRRARSAAQARGANSLGDVVGDDVVSGAPGRLRQRPCRRDHAPQQPAARRLGRHAGARDRDQRRRPDLRDRDQGRPGARVPPHARPLSRRRRHSSPPRRSSPASARRPTRSSSLPDSDGDRHRHHHARQRDPGDWPRQLLTNRQSHGYLGRPQEPHGRDLSFTPPGGTWDFADDGTYTVTLTNNVVKSTTGQSISPAGRWGISSRRSRQCAGRSPAPCSTTPTPTARATRAKGACRTPTSSSTSTPTASSTPGIAITQTDANGAYTFGGSAAGQLPRHGARRTLPHAVISPTNDLHFVTLTAGQNLTGQDFGDVADPQIVDIVGQNLVQAHGSTPQFDQDGTLLHIIGRNFDPGRRFLLRQRPVRHPADQPRRGSERRPSVVRHPRFQVRDHRPLGRPLPQRSRDGLALQLHRRQLPRRQRLFVRQRRHGLQRLHASTTSPGCMARTRPTSASTPAASSLSDWRIAR